MWARGKDVAQLYRKLRISIDDATWTPVSSPINTRNVVVKNSGASPVLIRINTADDATEDILPALAQEAIHLEFGGFVANQPFMFAKVQSGAGGPLIITATG